MKQVIVTTEYRGVFHGTLSEYDRDKRRAVLHDARCVIRWGTTEGWLELAAAGPNRKSKLGSKVPRIELPGITSVADVTADAAAKWDAA